jgi:hypothetical protein
MKWIAIVMAILAMALAILYSIVGGVVLAIMLGTTTVTTIILAIFSLGIWYAHTSIRLGARISSEAINNNDRWDSIKMQALAQYGSEIFKLKSQNADRGFPLLGSGDDTFDASFTIQGADDEDEIRQ